MAYIPSLRVLKEGGYEGGGSMPIYGLPAVWGPKIEEIIVAAVQKQVEAVRRSEKIEISDTEYARLDSNQQPSVP